jgi:hypothetical protein
MPTLAHAIVAAVLTELCGRCVLGDPRDPLTLAEMEDLRQGLLRQVEAVLAQEGRRGQETQP